MWRIRRYARAVQDVGYYLDYHMEIYAKQGRPIAEVDGVKYSNPQKASKALKEWRELLIEGNAPY